MLEVCNRTQLEELRSREMLEVCNRTQLEELRSRVVSETRYFKVIPVSHRVSGSPKVLSAIKNTLKLLDDEPRRISYRLKKNHLEINNYKKDGEGGGVVALFVCYPCEGCSGNTGGYVTGNQCSCCCSGGNAFNFMQYAQTVQNIQMLQQMGLLNSTTDVHTSRVVLVVDSVLPSGQLVSGNFGNVMSLILESHWNHFDSYASHIRCSYTMARSSHFSI
uniref:Uncharacterized protein n=1 Tax=Timema cristinae TaxID=61476 RepID=A0A7R9D0T5_TIMCR|nr:unnamed protein product [Timema cristinae]